MSKKEKPLKLNRTLTRGEIYNLDKTLALIICPVLIDFNKAAIGYPGCVRSLEKWHKVIETMIFSFKEIGNCYENKPQDTDNPKAVVKYNKKINKGLKLFAHYYNNLWI